MEKAWWASKTLWTNVVGVTAGALSAGGPLEHVLAPEEVGLGLGIANILLRFATSKKLVF